MLPIIPNIDKRFATMHFPAETLVLSCSDYHGTEQSVASPRPSRHWVKFPSFWSFFGRYWWITHTCPPASSAPPAQLLARTATSWVFTTPPTSSTRVIKVSRDTLLLYQEYKTQQDVDSTFTVVHRELFDQGFEVFLPFVPRCFQFHANVLASEHHDIFKNIQHLPKNSAAYTMEYIRSFNKYHVKYLVKRHISKCVQDRAICDTVDPHFLAKVRMGDLQPLSDRWQTELRDRPAYIDQLYAEQVDICSLASSMGSALGALHWACGIDAAGVDFMLGCDRRGHVQLWLIDFANCRPFRKTAGAVTTHLVDAVMQNGACWPRWIGTRPFRDVWAAFRRAYLEISAHIFTDDNDGRTTAFLPLLFINELETMRGPKGVLS
ncbi:hypothetical protein Purlil1_12521 [Purpureocillium lilacinum]|uniref:DUF3669 domain-containing protein n=1 Tax=Purpureocillium lilacinum TaxID=33203 RepID=A0ABR0BGN8_PURLI|nr:hypothetical protein Purlil1_12521 [Purpureocillium lilacinum]